MLGGISVWQLLIILAIVIMIFGTKKLRSLGGDLGGAIKSFKKAVNEDDAKKADEAPAEKLEDKSGEQADAQFKTQTKDQDKA
ncbi:MAG: twin-arginine translocase subunit TatA [Oceanospirillaceae bacterium]|uniref:twin-arginine translocase TatA/TatE family subunit n=1 Tax=unclassified Thalassolituus TaxID=2624967 RepID=UPI000C0B2FE1|nr:MULTISPECIES: twin-arginine translocase TatA/TatE family subunit [unclassified Thalassolituus]MAK92347.1 twin-arginine translocase subunit TatA [Thalassolituus sp.]MAX98627.1 twin-arginine translocase subunit TatA [Oceanospirillaceae bacterium]MBS53640.1 twin-arginine translocase subunit TatA [Oceanospirillaceae bacterium]|tara:strand:+ start:233 stop:481 length:249 start_codon:yes stop_codon:yes gene_type:complete